MAVYERADDLLPAGGAGVRRPSETSLIGVTGPDAVDFLHRLSSQDIAGLAPGASAPAAFLTAKGRLVTTVVVGRAADDRLWVEVQAHVRDELYELLERSHFTEKLSIESADGFACVMLFGRRALSVARVEDRVCTEADGLVLLSGTRHGFQWVRAHGPATKVDGWQSERPVLADNVFECLRMVAGEVRIGTDTDASTIVLEAGLADHVSQTKGCYTGQEIVARIGTYGHVNRELVLLVINTAEPIAAGAKIVELSGGEPVGRITSAAPVPGTGHSVALGYLPVAIKEEPPALGLGSADGAEIQLLDFGPA